MTDDVSTEAQMSNDLLNGTHSNPFENIDWPPLKLTDRQRHLCNLLDREGGGRYQLDDLYSGAIRVLSDPNNPDRIAQAANSLRELLEKLLLLVSGYVRKDRSEFSKMRTDMADLLIEYKETGDDGVKEKLHDKLAEYLELSKTRHAPRAEQIGSATAPSYEGDNKLAKVRGKQAKKLWDKLERCTHHGKCDDSFEKILEEFKEILEEFEKTVDLILASAVVINQKEIQKIVRSNDRSKQSINPLFRLIGNNEANRKYFFELITEKADATWLLILEEKSYFKNPPEVEHSNNGWMTLPSWLPMSYLVKMASCKPNEVTKIVANIPRVCEQIVEIATLLSPDLSLGLKTKVVEYVSKSSHISGDEIAKLLDYWAKNNKIDAFLDLLRELARFDPDPKDEEKRSQRKSCDHQKSNTELESSLKPSHRMDRYFFRETMTNNVCPHIEKSPFGIAVVLIKAMSNLIALKFHDEEGDSSGEDIWYKGLAMQNDSDEYLRNTRGHEEVLVDTMTLACEKIYEKHPDKIEALDKILRNEKWEFFKQLRIRLYSNHLTSTKFLIKELILEHKGYGKKQFYQDFWKLIESACKHFGEELLTIEERTNIFEAINNVHLGSIQRQMYTEDYLRYWQFFPFKSVLFGKYQDIYQKLSDNVPEEKREEPVHHCPPHKDRISMFDYSPFSHKEIASWSDEELLNRINTWNREDGFSKDGKILSINKSGFAAMLYGVFKETIVCDRKRMAFWQQKWGEIKHPIYVREMIYAMHECVKDRQYGMLEEYLIISEKVLIRSNEERRSGEYNWMNREPGWSSTRWPICELVSTYLNQEIEPTPSVWDCLTKVLTMLCTQYDHALDNEQRLSSQAEHALKPEEYAILGVNYLRLHFLDKQWARENRLKIFPQDNLPAWTAAFGALLLYCRPCKEMFEIVYENFAFAMQHLDEFRAKDNYGDAMLNAFELKLFNFYLEDEYPLVGDVSLLEKYYQKTASDKKGRGDLIYKLGDSLRDKNNKFSKESAEKIIDFFRARIDAGDFVRMDSFSPWLDVEHLTIKERLSACLKVLDTCEIKSYSTYVWLEKFCKMLPDHTAEVVECFKKLVCQENSNIDYIDEEKVNIIVTTGRNSGDEVIIKNVNHALNCLRRKSLISSLTLDD